MKNFQKKAKSTSKFFLSFSFAALVSVGGFASYTHADTIQDFIASLATKELGLHIEDNAAVEGDLYVGSNLGVGTTNPTDKLTVDGVVKTSGGIRFSDGSLQGSAVSIRSASVYEAQLGSDNYAMMTPLRTKQAIDANLTNIMTTNKVSQFTSNKTLSSTNETTILSGYIPSNTLGTNNLVKFKINVGDYGKNINGTLTIRLKYGATTLTSVSLNRRDTFLTGKSLIISGELYGAGSTTSQEGTLAVQMFNSSGEINSLVDTHTRMSVGTSYENSTLNNIFSVTAQVNSYNGYYDVFNVSNGYVEIIK